MQRSMTILRAVVLEIESGDISVLAQESAIAMHITMAVECGLVNGMEFGSGSKKYYPAASLTLTPAGHEFAGLARNDDIWDSVATYIQDVVGTTSFAVWLGMLTAEHTKMLKRD